MSSDKTITNGKFPDRVCPTCGAQVNKAVREGYLVYQCQVHPEHWDDWEDAVKKSAVA